MVFLDIQGALEKVWHLGLLAKLNQIGIDGKFHELLKSYLFKRKQIVVIDCVKSESRDILAGVPQGSRLGPLLFIIYINDIIFNLESEIFFFADDSTSSCNEKDANQTSAMLNTDLKRILEWSKKWKITFQPTKLKI